MAHGAVMTGIRAGDRAFKSAKKIRGWVTGGVFDECTSNKLDHGVVVVGWGEEWGYSSKYKRKMNKKYWLIKNSWGTGWGDEGYLKVERGQCGLGSVSYLTIHLLCSLDLKVLIRNLHVASN